MRRVALVCAAAIVVVVAAAGTADAAWTSSAAVSHSVSSLTLTAPTGLANTGAGTILFVTWADFSWNALTGATSFDIEMDPYGFGCLVTVNETVSGPTSGRVEDTLLCLGTRYNVRIRGKNGNWVGSWSSWVDIGVL